MDEEKNGDSNNSQERSLTKEQSGKNDDFSPFEDRDPQQNK